MLLAFYETNKPQSWTKGSRQIDEIKQNRFSMECFTADFLQFLTKKRQNSALG